MNIQSNITIFTGDTQSRSQAERAGADRNTQDSKGKSATFYAGPPVHCHNGLRLTLRNCKPL